MKAMPLILLALLLGGCRSHPLAPAANAEPATAPQIAPGANGNGPTRSVELKNLKVALVTATWNEFVRDDQGFLVPVPTSGPAIQFSAGLDLHGWTLRQFNGSRFSPYRWAFNISIDSDGPGLYDGEWDFDAYHTDFGDFGTGVTVHDRSDEEYVRDISHGADIALLASDRDSLVGAGGVRFTLPLRDFGLTEGPVRWKLYTADDFHFPIEQYIGITGDGTNAAPVVEWSTGGKDALRNLQGTRRLEMAPQSVERRAGRR